jgi:hypothetical protein
MHESVFLQVEFFLLVVFSTISPIGIYAYMMWKSAISRNTVLLFGIILIVLAGVDVFLLQRLTELAKYSPSLLDDAIFASELSVALYLLPALFGGVGINMVSHVLISHVASAERLFDRTHKSENIAPE